MNKIKQFLGNKKVALCIDILAVVNLTLGIISAFNTTPFWNFYGMYIAIPVIILHQAVDAVMKKGLYCKKNWIG